MIIHSCVSQISSQNCDIREEGKKHFLILYDCQLDQAGQVSFQAANAKSEAYLRVKRKYNVTLGVLKSIFGPPQRSVSQDYTGHFQQNKCTSDHTEI